MTADFIEIGTDDMASARAFDEGVFDWRWVPMGTGPQGYFSDGKRQIGAHDGETPGVVPILRVAGIADAISRVIGPGGSVTGEEAEAPELGRFATRSDPRGARFGLHQPE